MNESDLLLIYPTAEPIFQMAASISRLPHTLLSGTLTLYESGHRYDYNRRNTVISVRS